MTSWKRSLAVLWIAEFLCILGFTLSGPFFPEYLKELGVTAPDQIKTTMGIIGVCFSVPMAIFSPLWGRLADRYGRKLMLMRSMVAAILILAGMGFSKSLMPFLFFRVLQGALTGTVPAATAFMAANSPRDKLAYSLGILGSACYLGSAVGPLLGADLATRFGLRLTFFLGSALLALATILALICLKEDRSTYGPRTDGRAHPSLAYFLPYVGFVLFGLMVLGFSRSMFEPFLLIFLKEQNGSEGILQLTGWVTLGVNLATAAAGLMLAKLCEAMSKTNILRLCFAGSGLLSFALIFHSGLLMFSILYIALFFFLGAIEPVMNALAAERIRPTDRGTLFGWQSMIFSMGWILSPLVGSFLSIRFGFYALFGAMAAGVAVMIVLHLLDIRYSRKEEAR